jgi:RNA polymerase sigma-70 factor (ECF subfamily)
MPGSEKRVRLYGDKRPADTANSRSEQIPLDGHMVDDDLSTTQLVMATKDGDNEALGRLLEQYRGYLLMLAHRYLSERLRRRVDPSDIVQLTFLEAKRDLGAFRGQTPAEFAGWLRGMLKNNVATAVTRHITTQKRSIKREVTASPTAEQDSGQGGWIHQLPGSTTSPSGVAIRAEAVVALLEALHQLPETQAEAIRLRYMEGLPLAEIVERLGKSETAVAGLLKRGLQKLRTVLDHEANPWL